MDRPNTPRIKIAEGLANLTEGLKSSN
jgi:hypothetical protein